MFVPVPSSFINRLNISFPWLQLQEFSRIKFPHALYSNSLKGVESQILHLYQDSSREKSQL